MLDVYGDVASGLKECLKSMGPWSVGDLTLGIRHVGKRHDRLDVSDRLPGPPLQGSTSASTFALLRREIKFTQAAYSIPDSPAMANKAEFTDTDCVLHMYNETAKFQPAYALIKDNEAKLVRVVVRGTNDLNDVLTDSALPSTPAHVAVSCMCPDCILLVLSALQKRVVAASSLKCCSVQWPVWLSQLRVAAHTKGCCKLPTGS